MPKYLIRLDDACHQSYWDNWDKIQQAADFPVGMSSAVRKK